MSVMAGACLLALPATALAAPVRPWAVAVAQSPAAQGGGQSGENQASEGAGGEPERRNEIALLLGGTYQEEENYFTIGLEYQRTFSDRLDVAVAVEHLSGKDSWVYVFLAKFRVYKGIKLLAGPGFEREHGENDFLFRIGGGYGFEFGERYSFVPSLELDFIGRDTALVYGATLGVGF